MQVGGRQKKGLNVYKYGVAGSVGRILHNKAIERTRLSNL